MVRRIIVAGGGTGGHLYPGLVVAEKLRELGHEVWFVGNRRGVEARVVPEAGYEIYFVRSRGLTGGVVASFYSLLEMSLGLVQSFILLLRRPVELIVATGGYSCVPVVMSAFCLKVPVVLLEQNAVPGKATRFLSRIARRVCVSFPQTASWFPADKVTVTGNPVRPSIITRERVEARKSLGIGLERKCLLVTGASQGASSINKGVLSALEKWRQLPWTVIHITGPSHYSYVKQRAESIVRGGCLDYRCYGYFDDMADAYAAADLAVARAGATTVAELTVRGLPAVLVPYPFSAQGHQLENARVMVEAKAALLLEDSEVEKQLSDVVCDLLSDDDKLEEMACNCQGLGRPEALSSVIECLDDLVDLGVRGAGDGKGC